MKTKNIIILGAGRFGRNVAAHLISEDNNVTVVDEDEARLKNLRTRFDLNTVLGHAAHPSTLELAGADNADILLAVTNNDETNIVACQVAWALFHTPIKIARVRAQDYYNRDILSGYKKLGLSIDLINPEKLVTDYILKLLQYPGALQVLDFANELAQMVSVRVNKKSPLVGAPVKQLNQRLKKGEARVAVIYRHGQAIFPQGHTLIKAGDELFFMASREIILNVLNELVPDQKPYERILIAGGGHIGYRIAKELEENKTFRKISIVESRNQRSQSIAKELKKTLVIKAEATDKNILEEENIQQIDLFCSVTNHDETNILSAMLAKSLGAKKAMALVNHSVYLNIAESSRSIDIPISPQHITIGELLVHITEVDISRIYSLRNGAAEAIEITAHGNKQYSKVVERRIDQIPLPEGTCIVAIVRDQSILIPHHDTVIQADDKIILFLAEKEALKSVQKLFRVSQGFIA